MLTGRRPVVIRKLDEYLPGDELFWVSSGLSVEFANDDTGEGNPEYHGHTESRRPRIDRRSYRCEGVDERASYMPDDQVQQAEQQERPDSAVSRVVGGHARRSFGHVAGSTACQMNGGPAAHGDQD